jgi:release factor glutamine methyltransferase
VLARSGLERIEARLLLEHVTGWSREQLLAHPEWPVGDAERAAFEALVARREADEPIAYLLGEREFYGRLFKVDRRALIPRPETELLVELGVAAVNRWRTSGVEPRVVDVGTGCGAIGVSVALEAGVGLVASDVAFEALTLAAENVEVYGAKVALVQANLLEGLRGPFHVVLANLPYVPSGRKLPRDVVGYEPSVALFGGKRGTELIERFLQDVRGELADGGEVCVELDEEEQAAPVAELAQRLYPGATVGVCRDAGGYDRVVRVTRRGG